MLAILNVDSAVAVLSMLGIIFVVALMRIQVDEDEWTRGHL
jgi:hypothetical protein